MLRYFYLVPLLCYGVQAIAVPRVEAISEGHTEHIRDVELMSATLEKRSLAAVASYVFDVANNPLTQIVIGMATLVTSSFNWRTNCDPNADGTQYDCLFDTVDIAFNIFGVAYANSDLRAKYPKREETSLPSYGEVQMSRNRSLIAHIPVQNGTTLRHGFESLNGSDWTHIASVKTGNSVTHHAFYRLASEEDLGKPNKGSVHQLRTQSANTPLAGKSRRAETSDEGGVIVDYLWKYNDYSVYYDIGWTQANADSIGENTANWLETNYADPSCASLGAQDEESEVLPMNAGLIGFGWNDQAFEWDGRIDGWLDDCDWYTAG